MGDGVEGTRTELGEYPSSQFTTGNPAFFSFEDADGKYNALSTTLVAKHLKTAIGEDERIRNLRTSDKTFCAEVVETMSDIEYLHRVADPILRPLIDEMSKRMPGRPLDFIRAWAEHPPVLPEELSLDSRRLYYDSILGPIMQVVFHSVERRASGYGT